MMTAGSCRKPVPTKTNTAARLPLPRLPTLIGSIGADGPAIAVDLPACGFKIESLLEILDEIVGGTASELKVLLIDCDDERLQRRYTETRPPPPLAGHRPVMDGIGLERRVVFLLRARADFVIDTSNVPPIELERQLTDDFGRGAGGFRVFVTFFSNCLGIPRDARLIFEGRFLATTLGYTAGLRRSVYAIEWLTQQLRAAGTRLEMSHRGLRWFGPPGLFRSSVSVPAS
jgi:RNase adaptor protein for sRNA GlmZ degradation